jgi:hypothetical protein
MPPLEDIETIAGRTVFSPNLTLVLRGLIDIDILGYFLTYFVFSWKTLPTTIAFGIFSKED